MIQQYSITCIVLLYLQCVDTAILLGLSDFVSELPKINIIDILQKDKVIVMIFATHVAGAISDNRLKRKTY